MINTYPPSILHETGWERKRPRPVLKYISSNSHALIFSFKFINGILRVKQDIHTAVLKHLLGHAVCSHHGKFM